MWGPDLALRPAGSSEELEEEAWWWRGGEGTGEEGEAMEKRGAATETGCAGYRWPLPPHTKGRRWQPGRMLWLGASGAGASPPESPKGALGGRER